MDSCRRRRSAANTGSVMLRADKGGLKLLNTDLFLDVSGCAETLNECFQMLLFHES